MIYFDNSATGGFKPSTVIDATVTTLKYLTANPGRSGHRLSLVGANIVYDARVNVASLFSCNPNRVIFTKNCTEALNIALFGLIKNGCNVITTVYEHNSVLRPLKFLESSKKITLTIIDEKKENIDIAIKNAIKDDTFLVVTTACSNVNGDILPISKIAKICSEKGIKYIVDGAQAGGHINLKVGNGISAICLASHKGLLSPMGSGLLVFDDETEIAPLMFGGTGTESFNYTQPENYPEKLESGTLNLPAIAGLKEGILYIKEHLQFINLRLEKLTLILIEKLKKIKGVEIYSSPNPCGIVAFKISNYNSMEVSDILNREYDIAVRGGLHCAPLMHKHLNTFDDGLVRVSFSINNTESEINALIFHIKNIIKCS